MAFVKKADNISKPVLEEKVFDTAEGLIELANKHQIETDPINISELTHLLGIKVNYEPMEDDRSGELRKCRKTGKWIMKVNSLHHPRRQRFTIAHELGHFAKHAGLLDEFEDTTFFRDDETNWMEVEANKFAAELLMPEAKFIDYVNNVSAEVDEIAEYFQVSSMAVRVRAKVLGFRGHNL